MEAHFPRSALATHLRPLHLRECKVPGTLNTASDFAAKNTLWCHLLLLALPLDWIHSKTISIATFSIIGLTKIARIKFLPLDWIYHSIRIMAVSPHQRVLHLPVISSARAATVATLAWSKLHTKIMI